MNLSTTISGKGIIIDGRLIRTARLEAEKYHFIDDPPLVLEHLQLLRTRVDIFTFMQRVPYTIPKYAYPMEWDNLAVLPVSTFDHWWTKQIGFKTRNKAKQAAKKGIVVREIPFNDALVNGIWEVYNECPVRQGKAFHHYGKNLETVRREEGTFLDDSVFIGAFLDDNLVGFVKLVWDETKTQAGLMNIVSMIRHKDKAPTSALVAEAVRACADRGISYLVYSRFTESKTSRCGLQDFKERNGFQQMNLPRYYVPLSSVGKLALRLGLHRPVVERFPEAITDRVREIRAFWHNRRVQSVSEAL
jgi:hypothetical protein